MLHDSVRTHARARRAHAPASHAATTMIMKTQTHGFPNFCTRTTVMGLRSAALRAAGELRYYSGYAISSLDHERSRFNTIESVLSSLGYGNAWTGCV